MSFLDRIKNFRLIILIGFTACVLFFNLNSWSVTESSEARYAQISKEMIDSGDWIHPQLMGIYHYHKPPLTYWITAFSFKIFGATPFAARFFLQISLLLQIFLVYKIALLQLRDSRIAFLSALLYASFPVVIIASRGLTTDSYLTTFVFLTVFFWFKYQIDKKKLFLMLSFLFLGFGFLTKGPVVLVVPFIVWIVDLFLKKWRIKLGLFKIFSILPFLLVGFFWFFLLYFEDERFLDYFLFKHTIQRFSTNTFSRSQPFWFYLVLLIVTAFPWFIILLSKLKEQLKFCENPQKLFLAWAVLPMIFFSLSKSKLILYILPVFGGFAIATVVIWNSLSDIAQKKWEKFQLGFQILCLFGLIVSPFFDSRIVLHYKFIFIWVLLISILFSMQFSGIPRNYRAIVSAWIFAMGLTLLSTYFFSKNPEIVNDTRRLVQWIDQNRSIDEKIIVYNKRLPSISFQTNKQIISIYDGDESLNRETQFQTNQLWKNYLINLKNNPGWITEPKNLDGIWLVKLNSNLPKNQIGHWETLKQIDGWKIMIFKLENK